VVFTFHYKTANGDGVHVSRRQAAQVELVEVEVCGEDKEVVTRAVSLLRELEPRQETLQLTEKVWLAIDCKPPA
jgi:hypothetical protein